MIDFGFEEVEDSWRLVVDSNFTISDFYANSTSDVMNWILETFHGTLVSTIESFLDYASSILQQQVEDFNLKISNKQYQIFIRDVLQYSGLMYPSHEKYLMNFTSTSPPQIDSSK